MINYRGFYVWGVSSIVIIGAFLVFVMAGWPGTPSGCIYETPDSCYCEAFDIGEVEAGTPGVRQAVNTWPNLYSVFTSFIVALVVYYDRKRIKPGEAPNHIRSHSSIPDLYIFAVLFLGLGSMWFHGSLTKWGGLLDGISMYLFVVFLPLYSIYRFFKSGRLFWFYYVIIVALFTAWHIAVPSALVKILVLVGLYLLIEFTIWYRTGKVMQGKRKTVALWILAITAIGVATFFWWASHTGNFMCNPHSLFQPHGLLWHPLAGVTALAMYFYWREAEDPV